MCMYEKGQFQPSEVLSPDDSRPPPASNMEGSQSLIYTCYYNIG